MGGGQTALRATKHVSRHDTMGVADATFLGAAGDEVDGDR